MGMITYYSINITNKCNKACPYCVNKDYVNKAEYPDIMGFADLRNWLEKEIRENDIVEIAGTGEPTLCNWLPELLDYLKQKKTRVILKTNGFNLGEWRLPLDNLLVIMAKHDSSDDFI
jgi:molybdenum cofactor biosynthesis enzyme MoaA